MTQEIMKMKYHPEIQDVYIGAKIRGYSEYKKLADAENKVIFGGRLGEYKYYDMDQVMLCL